MRDLVVKDAARTARSRIEELLAFGSHLSVRG
jgi:hypothetical protein